MFLANTILTLLWIVGIPVGVYAFAHAAMQRADAYTAVGKLSKPAWMGITGGAALVLIFSIRGPHNLIWIAGLIAALVYILDVRPKVTEVQKGSSW